MKYCKNSSHRNLFKDLKMQFVILKGYQLRTDISPPLLKLCTLRRWSFKKKEWN